VGLAIAASLSVLATGFAGAPALVVLVAGGFAAAVIAIVGWSRSRPPLQPPLAALPETYGSVVIAAPRAGEQAAQDAA